MSLVAVLASTYPAVTVVLARRVHGEQLRAVQAVGVVAVLAGSATVALAGAVDRLLRTITCRRFRGARPAVSRRQDAMSATTPAAIAPAPGLGRGRRRLRPPSLAAAPVAFMVTTIPVAPGASRATACCSTAMLNNAAYEAAALVCLLRVLAQPARAWTAYLLPTALAVLRQRQRGLDGPRPSARPQPFPSGGRRLFLAFYPLVFVSP